MTERITSCCGDGDRFIPCQCPCLPVNAKDGLDTSEQSLRRNESIDESAIFNGMGTTIPSITPYGNAPFSRIGRLFLDLAIIHSVME